MTVADPIPSSAAAGPVPAVSHPSGRSAFKALLLRDAFVLRRNLKEFLPRTLIQPFLLVFVFTYVLPKIGMGLGGGTAAAGAAAAAYSASLIAGVIASVILFQGIQAVALPLVQEFGYTREIEDRVLAPLPVEMVAIEKIVGGALQCMIAALLVFPIAAIVPATDVHLSVTWPVLLTLLPLACVMASSLGLTFGTMFDPRTVPMLFGVIVVPITFLGCIYYPWQALSAIRWLQIASLANPLVYISEGFRAALTDVPHMSLWAIYPVMIAFTLLLAWNGVRGFKKSVIA
jgi:ABC-2 type transport system permease protein